MAKFKKDIEEAKGTMDELLFATRDFTDEAKEASKAVFGIGTNANNATKAFRDIGTSIANQAAMMDDIVSGTATAADLAKEQNKYAKAQDKLLVEQRQLLSKIAAQGGKMTDEQEYLKILYEEQLEVNKDNEKVMGEMARRAGNIQKGVGLAGAAFEGVGKALKNAGLSGIGEKMGLDEAVKKGRELSATLTDGGNLSATLGTKLRVAGKMAGTIGKNLLDSLGPMALLGKALSMLVLAFKDSDKEAGQLAKELGISHERAKELNSEMRGMQGTFNGVRISGQDIREDQAQINKFLGTSAKFSAKLSQDFSSIKEGTQLSDKAMGFFLVKQLKSGKTIKNQLKDITKTVQAENASRKMVANKREVMEEIAKLSNTIKLSSFGTAEGMTEAVMAAKELGANFQQLETIQSSLLNFESSIQSELEAELLLGRDINLEAARRAALTNDMVTLSEEVMNNEAIMNAFATDNFLAQEAAAKAIGLSRDSLADIIFQREQEAAISAALGENIQTASDYQAEYNRLKEADLLTDEKKKELAELGLLDQLESQSIQDHAAKVQEQIAESAKTLADNLVPSVESMIKFAKFAAISLTAIKTMQLFIKGSFLIQKAIEASKKRELLTEQTQKGLESASLMKSIGEGAMTAIKSLGAIPIIGIGLGLAAAATVIGLGMKYMDDGIIGPGGGMMVSGPKGSIQLNKDDSIIAGTNLGGGGEVNVQQQQNTDEMITLLREISNKNTVIEMGGNEVGQGINTAEREIQ